MRTLLACGCLAAARFVPFLAFFMSLIGSFLTIAVSVILPVSVHLKIFQVRNTFAALKASVLGLCSLQLRSAAVYPLQATDVTPRSLPRIPKWKHTLCFLGMKMAAKRQVLVQGKLSKQRLVWNWLVIAIGVVVALSGTSASVNALLASTAAA